MAKARAFVFAQGAGGSGKTTLAVNLAAWWASQGRRVLLVDMDPQGSAGAFLGLPDAGASRSVADVVRGAARLEDVTAKARDGLDLLPASGRLEAVEAGYYQGKVKADALAVALEGAPYDRVLLDPPPGFRPCALLAFLAARDLVVPVAMDAKAVRGLGMTEAYAASVEKDHAHRVRLLAVVPTYTDRRHGRTEEVLAYLEAEYRGRVAPEVHQASDLASRAAEGRTVADGGAMERCVDDFRSLAAWLDKH